MNRARLASASANVRYSLRYTSSALSVLKNASAWAFSYGLPVLAMMDHGVGRLQPRDVGRRGVLGGFKGSSQRLRERGCDGKAQAAAGGSGGAPAHAVAGASSGGPSRAPGVVIVGRFRVDTRA